jgi:hypothetical protein
LNEGVLVQERRYEVDRQFSRPDLTDCLPEGGALVPRSPVALRGADAVEGGLVPPSDRVGAKASTAGVVTDALRRDMSRIFGYDLLVYLREPLSDGDTAVHQMRVGCRRLRVDLRMLRPLLDAAVARRSWRKLGGAWATWKPANRPRLTGRLSS